jgi:hypothetical protein
VKSGSTADTAAGGPLDGVTVTILNADKRIGTHVFATVARNDCGHSDHSPIRCYGRNRPVAEADISITTDYARLRSPEFFPASGIPPRAAAILLYNLSVYSVIMALIARTPHNY